MGKFLRVLVVIILILTIASLTLATMLFSKREILKGRTSKLEKGLEGISLLLENEPPAVPEDPEVYPARDTSECTEEIIDSPQTSLFWDSYKQQLEIINDAFMGLKGRHDDLASYYKVDNEGKPVLDSRNMKITTGEGTTQGVIDDIIAHASAQLDILAETRQQLTDVRIELVDTINELNGRKITLREKLNKILAQAPEIESLKATISNLRNTIEENAEVVAGLEGDITALKQEKRAILEQIESLNISKEEQKQIISGLRQRVSVLEGGDSGPGEGPQTESYGLKDVKITTGSKGVVASVDQDNQFVVIEIEEVFLDELHNSTPKDGYIPLVDLIIKRGNNQFISKVRIEQINEKDKLVVGEILLNWQQGPIKVGDTVFYQ